MKSNTDHSKNALQDTEDRISPLEWVTTIVGVLLVFGVVGYLLYEALFFAETPPNVVVQVVEIVEIQEVHYIVRVEAENRGGITAAGVTVEGALYDGDVRVEMRSSTITFVPPHSVRRAGLFFENDPRDYEVRVAAVGYEQP